MSGLTFFRLYRFRVFVALALLLFFLVLPTPPAAHAIAFYTVDRGDDASGLACTSSASDCSLRSAVEHANSDGADSYIFFDANYSIGLGSVLFLSESGTAISGLGHSVKVSGNDSTNNVFRITGNDIILDTLRIYGSASGWANIYVTGTAQRAIISNNIIGDDNSSGTCDVSPNSHSGIYIDSTGSIATGDARVWIFGNFIRCNHGLPGHGIQAVSTDHVVVGVDNLGNVGVAQLNYIQENQGSGVTLTNGSNHTIRNSYLRLNTGSGAYIDGSANNVVAGNTILANSSHGVEIRNLTAHDNTIGGDVAADRNLISGNGGDGIHLSLGANNNQIESNFIGLDATYTTASPNGFAGIGIYGANQNSIGTSVSAQAQMISGNTREGVYVENSNGISIGPNNYIGVAANATSPVGNGFQGIMFNNVMTTVVTSALIAYNHQAGISVLGNSSTVQIQPNAVYENRGLPIDLLNNGATVNDPGDADTGPNSLLNYPVITSGAGSGVSGTACANCAVNIYHAIGNPAAAGGGGTKVALVFANGAGTWSTTLPDGLTRVDVSLSATRSSNGETSEMSPRPVLYLPLIKK